MRKKHFDVWFNKFVWKFVCPGMCDRLTSKGSKITKRLFPEALYIFLKLKLSIQEIRSIQQTRDYENNTKLFQ